MSAAKARARKDRGRPGRLRRWVVRPFVWGLVLLLALLASLWLLANSPLGRERLRGLLVASGSQYLGRRVTLRTVEVELLPPALVLRDAVVPGPGPGDPPVLVAPRVRVAVGLSLLRRKVVDLEQIEAYRPEIYLEVHPDGTTNFPRLRRRSGRRGPIEVRVGRILIEDGTLRLNERKLPLAVDAKGVRGRVTGRADRGGEGGDRLDVLVSVDEAVTSLPEARPYAFAMRLAGSVWPREARARIDRFQLSSPDLQGRFQGTVSWLDIPHVDLAGSSRGSLRLLTRLGYVHDPLAGGFSADARLALAGKDWKVTATASSAAVTFGHRSLADVATRLEVDRTGTRATVEGARHAGGTVTGLVHAGFSRLPEGGVPVDLDLALDGLALEALVADLAQGRTLPVVSRLTGRVDGRLRYRFASGALLAGEGTADLDLHGTSTAGLPLTGKAQLRFAGGVVEASGLALTSPGQEIAVRALRYDMLGQRGALNLAVDSRDLAPLSAAVVPGPPPFWLPTAGTGRTTVDLQLSADATTARVDLDLASVAAPALAAERARGGFAISGQAVEDLRLELTGGGGALLLTGRIPLTDEPLALAVDAVGWPVEGLRYFLPAATPRELSGAVSGRLDLSGPAQAPIGKAELAIDRLSLWGRPLGQAQGELAFDASELALDHVLLDTPAGQLAGHGRFGLDSGAVDLSLQAPSLALSEPPIAGLLPGLAGTASVAAAVSGTLDEPEVTLSVEGRQASFDGVPLGAEGRVSLLARLAGGALEASLEGHGLARLAGSGTLDREKAQFAGTLATDQLATLAKLWSDRLPADFEGSVAGSFSVAADFTRKDWSGRIEIPAVEIAAAGHRLENLEPVVADFNPERVALRSLYLSEPATESELFATGTVGFAEGLPLDLRLQVSGNAGWAEIVLPPGSQASGSIDLLAAVRGTVQSPEITGQGEIRDGRLFLAGFAQVFDDIDGLFSLDEQRLELEQLRARLGGGTLRASGTMALPGAGRPGGSYRLSFLAEDVTLRYPAGVASRGNAELVLASSEGGRQVNGLVDLQRALYVEDFAVGTIDLLRSFFERQRQVVEETDDLLATTQLNVVVRGPGALRIRNNLADLTGDVDLTIRGTAARPVVFGRLEAAEGGEIVWNDTRYQVQRATVTFNNPYRIEPVFDLVATTEIKSFDIALTLDGPLDNLHTRFSSNANLADLEILSLLTTGDRPGEVPVTPGQPVAPGALAQQFLYGQAASALSKRVGTLFGFDRFRIDPLAGSGQAVSSVGITVGKKLSRDVFVTYSSEPTSERNYVVQVEWQVARNVTLVLTQAGDGTYAVDAQWERRF